jgi:hypothetical protein
LRDARYNLVRTTNTASAADRTLTINPDEDLKPSATYYLWVRMMDTTDAQYWTVPATSTVVDVDQYFAPSTGLPPQNDSKNYIGFSTQKDQVARLASTNLYLDGNPAYYSTDDGPYFRLDGSIVLTFADVPDGTRISKAVLNLEAYKNAATGLSVYSTLATDATTKVTTVTITPNVKLAADATYHLQLALSKTIGADPVWSVTAANNQDGIHGLVYVDHESSMSTIAFKTVTRFSVKTDSSSLTNLEANNFIFGTASDTATNDFDATGDIVIEFDRPVATVNKAQLRYYDGAEYYSTTVSADNNNLSPDKTVLTIAPTNLLAPGSTFVVRLDVTSADGQQLVFDSTDTRNPSTWANYGSGAGYYFGDLHIETDGDIRLTGISKSPVTSGALTVPAGLITKSDTSITNLSFVPVAANFGQDYDIYAMRYDLWFDADGNPVNGVTPILTPVDVAQGATVPGGGNPFSIDIPGSADHFNAENIQYKARGINNQGYATEATSRLLTFTP